MLKRMESAAGGGGVQYKEGTFTSSISGTDITLPFEPSVVMAWLTEDSALGNREVWVYNKDMLGGYNCRFQVISNHTNAGNIVSDTYMTVNGNTVTFKSFNANYAGKSAKYVAYS